MKVWRLRTDGDNYDHLQFYDLCESTKFNYYGFNGHPIEDWKNLKVKVAEYKQRSNALSLLPEVLILDNYGIDCFENLLKYNTQIMPLEFKNEYYPRLSIVNIFIVRHAIDYEKAVVKKFKNTDKIMYFIKYAFNSERIQGIPIFKIAEEPLRIFVTDIFREKVLENNIKGIIFEEIWDSKR